MRGLGLVGEKSEGETKSGNAGQRANNRQHNARKALLSGLRLGPAGIELG